MNPLQILIIEDDRDIRKNLILLLESEGYTVAAAENGRVALERLRSPGGLPELIFLDLMMPIMDGFQFRQEQLRDSTLASIPVVIMTAESRIDETRLGSKVDASLKKPANIDAILDVAKKFVKSA